MGGDALRLHFRPARGRGAGQEIDGERAGGGEKTNRNRTELHTFLLHGATARGFHLCLAGRSGTPLVEYQLAPQHTSEAQAPSLKNSKGKKMAS